MFSSYYGDRLYLQIIATIFESSLVVAVKNDLIAIPSEKRKCFAYVVADKRYCANVSAEVIAVCSYN